MRSAMERVTAIRRRIGGVLWIGERRRLARCVTASRNILSGNFYDAGSCRKEQAGACAPRNAEDRARFLIDAFGRENVFVEIQRHFIRGEERINRELIDLARLNRLPLLATNGVQYAKQYGREVLDVFTCIREHTHLDAAGKFLTTKCRTASEE